MDVITLVYFYQKVPAYCYQMDLDVIMLVYFYQKVPAYCYWMDVGFQGLPLEHNPLFDKLIDKFNPLIRGFPLIPDNKEQLCTPNLLCLLV